jgi:hypothetical protein
MLTELRNWPRLAIACLILAALVATGCRSDPNVMLIQGTWTLIDETGSADPDRIDWQFSSGRFFRWQELTRGDSESTAGSYRVQESEPEHIVLELYDISGERISYENNSTTIQIDIEGPEQIRIDRLLYVRVSD